MILRAGLDPFFRSGKSQASRPFVFRGRGEKLAFFAPKKDDFTQLLQLY